MKRCLKALEILEARQQDYATLMDTRSKETKVQLRKETGGYHKPGAGDLCVGDRQASKKKNRVKRTSKVAERLKALFKATGCHDLKRYA